MAARLVRCDVEAPVTRRSSSAGERGEGSGKEGIVSERMCVAVEGGDVDGRDQGWRTKGNRSLSSVVEGTEYQRVGWRSRR